MIEACSQLVQMYYKTRHDCVETDSQWIVQRIKIYSYDQMIYAELKYVVEYGTHEYNWDFELHIA